LPASEYVLSIASRHGLLKNAEARCKKPAVMT